MYSNKQIEKYFNIAKKTSALSTYKNEHIGAIIVYKNKILTTGYNTNYSHPMQKHYNRFRTSKSRFYDTEKMNNYLHSEMSCIASIKHLNINYNKCSIFVYRQNKNGNIALAKPCKACEKMLKDYNINNIYYTTNEGWVYENRNNKGEKLWQEERKV